MNTTTPIARPRTTIAEPVGILVIGSRQGIQETIDQLCNLLHYTAHLQSFRQLHPALRRSLNGFFQERHALRQRLNFTVS
jgi:hypothetical protein